MYPYVRDDLIRNLERNSPALTRLASESVEQFKGKRIASFRETVKWQGMGIDAVVSISSFSK
jgi:hypothetical protein